MKYSSKKKKISISNIFQLSVVSFLTLSFFVGIAALMSGGFDVRQQAATNPYPSPTPTIVSSCIAANQCIPPGSTLPCCPGYVKKNDTTTCLADTAGNKYRCLAAPQPTTILMVPTATPVASGSCIASGGKTTCPDAGYYPAVKCSAVCGTGSICCGPKIPNQICVPNQVICGPIVGTNAFASYKCNSLGTGWTETICAAGYVCSETTRLCVLPGH